MEAGLPRLVSPADDNMLGVAGCGGSPHPGASIYRISGPVQDLSDLCSWRLRQRAQLKVLRVQSRGTRVILLRRLQVATPHRQVPEQRRRDEVVRLQLLGLDQGSARVLVAVEPRERG